MASANGQRRMVEWTHGRMDFLHLPQCKQTGHTTQARRRRMWTVLDSSSPSPSPSWPFVLCFVFEHEPTLCHCHCCNMDMQLPPPPPTPSLPCTCVCTQILSRLVSVCARQRKEAHGNSIRCTYHVHKVLKRHIARPIRQLRLLGTLQQQLPFVHRHLG